MSPQLQSNIKYNVKMSYQLLVSDITIASEQELSFMDTRHQSYFRYMHDSCISFGGIKQL